MAEYTSLNGVQNSQRSTLSNLLIDNFVSFYDWGFLDKGGFYNIRGGTTDIYGGDKSILKPLRVPGKADGAVWQSYKENWVWETGVSVGQPIPISGVYVGGTFYPTGNTVKPFTLDYRNGNVTFTSGIPLNSTVKLEYSHKYINVVRANGVPWFRELQSGSFRNNNNDFAVHGSGTWAQLGQSRVQMPTVAIDVSSSSDFVPYELGGGQWVNNDITFYVITEKDWECRNIMDQISFQNDRDIYLYDTNLIAENDAFPLTSNHSLKENTLPSGLYPNLVDNYRYRNCYIYDSKCRPIVELNNNLYMGTVKCKTEVKAI